MILARGFIRRWRQEFQFCRVSRGAKTLISAEYPVELHFVMQFVMGGIYESDWTVSGEFANFPEA
jgi:hypothetical protein